MLLRIAGSCNPQGSIRFQVADHVSCIEKFPIAKLFIGHGLRPVAAKRHNVADAFSLQCLAVCLKVCLFESDTGHMGDGVDM